MKAIKKVLTGNTENQCVFYLSNIVTRCSIGSELLVHMTMKLLKTIYLEIKYSICVSKTSLYLMSSLLLSTPNFRNHPQAHD